jgi:hypothetical protein
MTFGQVLKKQFQTQKALYITTMIIVLSALPQTIVTFSLACTSFITWSLFLVVRSTRTWLYFLCITIDCAQEGVCCDINRQKLFQMDIR